MPATVVNDSFTDTAGTALNAHTGETGATWASSTGGGSTIVITDANRLRGGSTAVGFRYASGVTSSGDQDITGTYLQKSSGVGSLQIAGRVSTSAQTGYTLYHDSANNWRMHRSVGGSFTLLGTYSASLTNDVPVFAKLQIRDATKKAFIDGVERISTTDNTIASGTRVGVNNFVNTTNTTGVHLDNFLAEDPNASSSLDIAASISATAIITADLTVAKPVAAIVGVQAGVIAALTVAKPLAVTIPLVATVTAGLTVAKPVAAQINGVAGVMANLTLPSPLPPTVIVLAAPSAIGPLTAPAAIGPLTVRVP